ncbi:DUF1116 domain-containing protein [soil metagenome]
MTSDANSATTTIELPEQLQVVNVGLPVFGTAARAQGAEVAQVDWRIPAGGDEQMVAALTRLYGRYGARVGTANATVFDRLDQVAPQITRIVPIAEIAVDLPERTVLHSGPPLPWEDLCDPLRRSVRAAVVAEGWADAPADVDALVEAGDVGLSPANDHGGAVPMASAVGPSAPALVAEDPDGGARGFSAINQGPGTRAWMGTDAPEAVERLVWLTDVAGPVLAATLAGHGPVNVFSLAAQGLQMGDDLHMRTQAATNLLVRDLLPSLVALDDARAVEVARFLSSNHLFFLNFAMAAAKVAATTAADVAGSSVVVAMARNGTTFGIQLAGTGDRWFTAGAPPVGDALYHGDYGEDDAAADIGDSAVLELVGLGGAAAAASPAVAGFLGGTLEQAIETTETFEQLCVGRSRRFKLPYLGFRGSPVGVDARRVVELEQTPAINTGILDARDGRGQIGAGVARAPLSCFRDAVEALDQLLGEASE